MYIIDMYTSSSRAAAALSDGRGDGVEATWSRDGAVAATTSCAEHRGRSTWSERPQNRKRDRPLPSFLETIHEDGVKASLHNGTLSQHGLDDLRDLVHETYRARDVVQNFDVPDLLPGHR